MRSEIFQKDCSGFSEQKGLQGQREKQGRGAQRGGSVLAWRIPGMGSLVGCRLWGRTESDTTERLSSSSSM